MEFEAEEWVAIAGLLWDTLDLPPSEFEALNLGTCFGSRVLTMLWESPSPATWWSGVHLPAEYFSEEVHLLLLCDAVCTARTVLRGYETLGDRYWEQDGLRRIISMLLQATKTLGWLGHLPLMDELAGLVERLLRVQDRFYSFKEAHHLHALPVREGFEEFLFMRTDVALAVFLAKASRALLAPALADPDLNEWAASQCFRNLSNKDIAELKAAMAQGNWGPEALQEAQRKLLQMGTDLGKDGLILMTSDSPLDTWREAGGTEPEELRAFALSADHLAREAAESGIWPRREVLYFALAGASPVTRKHFLDRLPAQVVERMEEEIQWLGAVQHHAVRMAQQRWLDHSRLTKLACSSAPR